MDQIVLLKIESLQARVVQQAGLKLRQHGREVYTGTIAAYLDETASEPANLALLNLSTGAIRLRWAIVATLPILADASAAGEVPRDESGPLRVTFDESGTVPTDGYEFVATGGGEIAAGSLLSAAKVLSQSNGFRALPIKGKKTPILRAIGAGASVACALLPDSTLAVALPKSLGGGTQRVNLVGGFRLVPILTLAGRAPGKRSKR